jgi:anaerobic ribonucleoside-triphosphate reductase activating protein
LRIAGTVKDSIVDGPGLRYVIFTQGCPHHCKGCHNPETHDFSAGRIADTQQILEEIFSNPILRGVTFSGGEPFCQPEALVPMAEVIKKEGKHLMIFTGYLLEHLQKMENESVKRLLELADVIVDGPFILEEKNLTLSYRGSENQRVIDMVKTREKGEIVLYRSEYEDLW